MNTSFFNEDAEKSILGAALQDETALRLACEIQPEEFHEPRHRTILTALQALRSSGTPADMISVDDWLTKHGKGADAGGTAYLVDLITWAPTAVNVREYIRIVHECTARRKLYLIGKDLMTKAGGSEDVDESREWAARSVRDVRTGSGIDLISMAEAAQRTMDKYDRTHNGRGNQLKSGIDQLDDRTGGWHEGEYIAIGARPSVGKSILALTFCVNAAKQGKRVLLVSLEMSETQITERILANESSIPMGQITGGTVPDESMPAMGIAIGKIADLPLWYCLEATTVEKVRKAAYQLWENGGLDMIAIDYLQLMEATYAKKQNRQEQVSEISRGLRLLAQELKIPILVLTQLNRASVKSDRSGKAVKREPTMSEARESGSIEQDANVFMLMHNPDRDEMTTEADREMWDEIHDQQMVMTRLIIAKNRQGKLGRATLAFDGDHMRFLPIRKKDTPDDIPF